MSGPIGILGAGISGVAAARLLHRQGISGWCAASSPPEESRQRVLESLGFPWVAEPPIEGPERVIVSPGLPIDHAWLERYRNQGVTLEPEFELGARSLKGPVLAITGSLGKTTMAQVAQAVLKAGGRRVTLSGNIGVPVSEVALTCPDADVHVMELSSFQLEALHRFAPDVAVCLNLVPNHLDRHKDLKAYASAKARLFKNMTAEQAAYWPEDFPIRVRSAARRYHALAAPRSSWKATRFAEGPLAENLMRLWPGLEAWPLPDEALEKEVLARFIPPPHRMELLDMPGAGRVVDDSKSTCLAATAAALKVEGKGVHLIAGGRGKGEDPAELRPLLSELGVSVYLIGESAGTLADSWEGHAAYCERCGTLEHAVARAWARRDRSQPLLFSPGCASFDQFTGFAHRGEHFQQLVSGQARKNPLNGIHPE